MLRAQRADGRNRTRVDLFRREAPVSIRPHPQAGYTGFEPVISSVTGKRELRTSPIPRNWQGWRDSNPLGLSRTRAGLRIQALDRFAFIPSIAYSHNRVLTQSRIRAVAYSRSRVFAQSRIRAIWCGPRDSNS